MFMDHTTNSKKKNYSSIQKIMTKRNVYCIVESYKTFARTNTIIDIDLQMFYNHNNGHLGNAATIYPTALHCYYPGCSRAAMQALKGIRKNKFLLVPIYYIWVIRDNLGQNALSKGIYAPSGIRSHDLFIISWEHEQLRHSFFLLGMMYLFIPKNKGNCCIYATMNRYIR